MALTSLTPTERIANAAYSAHGANNRKAKLRDAAIGTGIAVDKMLALTGQTPPAVGVVFMPSETEREERRPLTPGLME